MAPYDDTMLIAYALDGGLGGYGMDELAERCLGHAPHGAQGGRRHAARRSVTFDQVPLDRATDYAAEDADIALRLWLALKPRLAAEHMATVYETLERPMVPVLARMEARGIKVDRQILSRLSGEFAQKLGALESEIYELAGEEFNIGSPKQLGDILFGKFGLPGGKKTKTGAWSTGADVLDELAAGGNTLAARILDWRQLSKLKSTYTDLLPGFIHPEHRPRPHLLCAGLDHHRPPVLLRSRTCRTSRSAPRRAGASAPPSSPSRAPSWSRPTTARSSCASSPTSPISGQLKQAFADGLDIHAMTASRDVRRAGRGHAAARSAAAPRRSISASSTAFPPSASPTSSASPRQEAGDYIKPLFRALPRHPATTWRRCASKVQRATATSPTLFGRKIHFAASTPRNPAERAFIDRAAINAPIQGSAADIIRRAMIRMEPALEQARLSAAMLLQVHDELIFEVPESEVEATIPVVTRVMEAAAEPAVQLSVPLQVDARAADNWDAAH